MNVFYRQCEGCTHEFEIEVIDSKVYADGYLPDEILHGVDTIYIWEDVPHMAPNDRECEGGVTVRKSELK